MKTLKLTIPERLVALGIFNNPENKVATENLKIYLEDVNKFSITAEQKEMVKWQNIEAEEDVVGDDGKVTVKKGTVVSVRWNEEGVEPFDIEIDEFTRKFLESQLDSMEGSASDPLALSIATLAEKVKA